MFRLPIEYYLLRFGHFIAWFIFWLLTCIGIRLPSLRPLDWIRTSGSQRQELRELLMLQKRLLSYSGQSMEICKNLCERALGDGRDYPNQGLFAQSALLLFMGILKDEGYFQIPHLDPKQDLSITESWRLAAIYRRQLALIENPDIASSVEDILSVFLTYLFQKQVVQFPSQADYEAQTFSVPLHGFLRDPAEAIEFIFGITMSS